MNDGALENAKHPKWKTFLYYAAFFCLMLAGFLMVFSMRNKAANTPNISESSVPFASGEIDKSSCIVW